MKSKCCKEDVKLNKSTNPYYVCTKCNKPCDGEVAFEVVGGKTIEDIINDFPQTIPKVGIMKGKPILSGTVSVAKLKKALQQAEARGAERVNSELVKEFKDMLIDIGISNEALRGCVTTNQINDAFTTFCASTHKALTPKE